MASHSGLQTLDPIQEGLNSAIAPRSPEQTRAHDDVLRVGRYEVSVRIAAGGMATVHLGRILGAAGFSRLVAVKRLHPQFAEDPDFETMFVEEAQLAARIHHPNVVSTLDVVASHGELLLVMEYVQGESLSRLMNLAQGGSKLPLPIALAIVCDALHGLHAAHEAKDRLGQPLGIVHRDVSPQNILVGTDGIARVIDFGIAKAATSLNTTQAGFVRGKVAYMAPEQLNGEPVTRRSDLYAIGVLLWELLVGERLFPGGTRPEIVQKIAGQIPRPRQKSPTIPEWLDRIVMRALAPLPALRFANAHDMALAIEESATMAPRAQIAKWVEAKAREALAKRAELVALVEAADRSLPPPAPPEPAPITRLAARPPVPVRSHPSPAPETPTVPPPAALQAAALAPTTPPPPTSQGSQGTPALVPTSWARRGLLIGGAVLTLAVLLAIGSASRGVVIGSSPNASQARVVSVVTPSTHTGVVVAPKTDSNPPDSPPAATVSAAPNPSSVSRAVSPRGVKVPAVRATPKAAKTKNCTPPFTTDSNGHRHFKAECF